MEFNLIDGTFTVAESQELLRQLVQVKLQFHENRISAGSSEEDISMRERRISQLQQELAAARAELQARSGSIQLSARVSFREV